MALTARRYQLGHAIRAPRRLSVADHPLQQRPLNGLVWVGLLGLEQADRLDPRGRWCVGGEYHGQQTGGVPRDG